MELAFVIYLIDNITALKGSFWDLGNMALTSVLLAIVTVFVLFIILITTDPDLACGNTAKEQRLADREKYLNLLKKFWKNAFFLSLPLFIIGSIFNTVLPSKDTAYKMLAAYGLQETVEAASKSEDVKRLASKSLTLIEKSIDDYNKSLDNKAKQEDNGSTESKEQSDEGKKD